MDTKYTVWKKRTVWVLAFFALTVFASIPCAAAEEPENWKPAPPMPDEFDWIQTKSGEWLKGEIIAMYDETLDFDSKEFNDQSIKWGKIQQIRSAQICLVRFLDNTIATGTILLEGDTILVMGEENLTRRRPEVLSIIPGEPRERNYWSGKINAGLNIRTGNTEQTEFNAKAGIVRRTPTDRINIDYLGNFSESDSVAIADNQRLNVNWNRFISNRLYWTPLYGELFRDRFQNISNRYTLGVGLGNTFVETSKIEWDITAGLAYQGTTFGDVLPDEDGTETSPALSLGTKYDHKLTGWMDFHLNYSFFIVSEQAGTYTHHLLTGFEFELVGDLDFDIDWVWDYIKNPRRNSDGGTPENSDFRMMLSLGYSF